MKRRNSLIAQILGVNVLLVTATLFAASVAAGLDLNVQSQRWQFLVLAMAIMLTLLVNMMMLQRRFSPLERLIERVEAIDPAQPAAFEAPEHNRVEEIDRLAASFQRLLERIDGEQRRSGRLVLRAQEEERKRVARDLHDEVNQALTAILLRLEALSQDSPPELAAELKGLKGLVNQAMEELLSLARQLRPSALDDHGLLPALDGQVRRFGNQTGIETVLHTNGASSTLTDDQEIVLYRVVQEALSNAAQHSGARHVAVNLGAPEGTVTLRVDDDGCGFDSTAERSRLGLDGMAERAKLVGGELRISSTPGDGTSITLEIPQKP